MSSGDIQDQYIEGGNSSQTVSGARSDKEVIARGAPSVSGSRNNQQNPQHSRDKRDGKGWGGGDEDREEMEFMTMLSEDGEREETLAGAGGIGDAIGRGRRREERMFLEV